MSTPSTASRRKTAKKQNGIAAQSPQKGGNGVPATSSGPRWTFLTNHSHVLVLLHNDPDVVLRQVALQVGITERAVQRIVQDLEAGGFIERERVGRRNRYHVLTDQPLRHPIEDHRCIGDLLQLVARDETT